MAGARIAGGLVAAAAAGVLLWLLAGPGRLGYDTAYALVWGDALVHGEAPDFGSPFAPTPHPLLNAVAAVAALLGSAREEALEALGFLSYGALGVAAYALGAVLFNRPTGVLFAVLLLTRPLVVAETLHASVDLPFLALMLGAAALVARDPRRSTAPLVLLGLAGLLRPEAWPLAALYGLWLVTRPDTTGRERARTVALVLAAPVLWCLADLLLTGDPLHSLLGTRELAARLERPRGVGAAIDVGPDLLSRLTRPTVLAAAVVGGVLLLWRRPGAAAAPLAAVALGLAGFLVLGALGLPLLSRYLLLPVAALALLAAAGVFAWRDAEERDERGPALAAAVVAGVLLAAGVPSLIDDLREIDGTAAQLRRAQDDLVPATRTAEPLLARGCGPLEVASFRMVPFVALTADTRPSRIDVIPSGRPRAGAVLLAARIDAAEGLAFLDPDTQLAQAPPPAGSRPATTTRYWEVRSACSAATSAAAP